MVDEIGKLLDMKTDSVYRRIRGETELSLSEAQKICRYFNLSLDEITNSNPANSVPFQYTSVDVAEPSSYMQYIKRLSETLSSLAETEDKKLFFALIAK